MLRLGWHLPTSPQSIIENLCEKIFTEGFSCTVQFFSNSPSKYYTISDTQMFKFYKLKEFFETKKILPFIHSSYLINLCRPDSTGVNLLCQDMKVLSVVTPSVYTSDSGVIVHMGKNVNKSSFADCVDVFIQNIQKVLHTTQGTLILETSTKSINGSDIFYDIEKLAHLYSCIPKELVRRIKFCIDTCHVFSSGYDISSPIGFKEFIRQFDSLIGIREIALIHLNDSKMPLDSKRDLHQDIEEGFIFKKQSSSLTSILHFASEFNIPVVLETPGYIGIDEEIKRIKQAYCNL